MPDLALIVGVVVLMTLAMVGLMVVYAARYKRVPPDHAMVLFGRKYMGGKGYAVWTGGGKFILPIVESYSLISLEPMELDLLVEDVVANVTAPQDQVRILQASVTAIAKVSDSPDVLQKAASMLVHKSRDEIKRIVLKTIEGHTRGILATKRTPEVDLEATADKIRESVGADLGAIGIEVRSLFLKIRDARPAAGVGAGTADQISRELHQIDLRLRRIEEKLGLTTSGTIP